MGEKKSQTAGGEMTDKIEIKEVKKILDKWYDKTPNYNLLVAEEICQLFEPKADGVIYTLNCDKCGEIFYSSDAFPSPQICPICSKPDETLTEQDIIPVPGTEYEREKLGWNKIDES